MRNKTAFFSPLLGILFGATLCGCGGGSDSAGMKQETMSVGAKIEREASVMPLCSARSLLEIRAEIEDKIGRSGSGLVVGVSDLSFNSGANGEYWHVPAKTREGKFGALVLYRCDGGVEILNE